MRKEDNVRAEDILGPNPGSLKGKMTCKTPSKVIIDACKSLPEGLPQEHSDTTLVVHIMYINKTPFVFMASRAIHFGTDEMIKNEKNTTIIN